MEVDLLTVRLKECERSVLFSLSRPLYRSDKVNRVWFETSETVDIFKIYKEMFDFNKGI